ncbi:MAG: AMP-binding protein [Candidatus Omnitrophica bacterium]|nr:AMP-binding protein [Candidatus Omnitrophota bacterium]
MKSIFESVKEAYSKSPQKELIYFKQGKNYTSLTYQDIYTQAIKLAYLLKKNNIKREDKVAIILENSPLWPSVYLGIMRIGAIAVPLYYQTEKNEIKDILVHSQCKIITTSSNLLTYLKEIGETLNIKTVTIDTDEITEDEKKIEEFLPKDNILPQTIASIVYTSGTTATPKGVILTHKNFLANVESIKKLNIITPNDCLISILPYHHTYPFVVNLLLPILTQAKISFPSHIEGEEILDCIQNTKVTVMVAVPRVLSLFYEKINAKLNSLPFYKKALVNILLNIGVFLRKKTSFNLAKIILKELHTKFGKGFRFLISGGSKLPVEIAQAFYKWGFTILEGYGLTEASPVITFNKPEDFKLGSIGKSIPDVEVKLYNPDENGIGEIIAKGENITQGYYNDPEYTKQVIKDGWLYTGDLAYKDKNGFYTIVGRKKEMLVLSSGKKIAPEELENYYLKSPYIKELCLFLSPSTKDALNAVILPNYEHFREREVTQIKDRIRWEIENLSHNLPLYKRIKNFIITNENLPRTILGKLKRYEIEKKYANLSTPQVTKKVLPEDSYLLNQPICQKALEYISQKLKRPVHLDDNLELDLGLDSLQQIEMLLDFEKLTNIQINEEELIGIFTMRDVIKKIFEHSQEKTSLTTTPLETKITQWKEILIETPPQIIKAVNIGQNLLKKFLSFILISLLAIMVRVIFRLRVKNKINIPKDTPYIISPNHCSYLDGFIVASALGPHIINKVFFLGYNIYFQQPFINWAGKIFRFIPIDPMINLIESMQACSYVLRNSKILCMFPEGTRSPDGKVKEFKKGIGILVKELNLPVLPIYIKGTFQAWPRYRLFPTISKIEVTIGEKISPETLIEEGKESLDIYQAIANRLRDKVLELSSNNQFS